MPINPVKCPHGKNLGICSLCKEKFFKEKYWVDGWGLDAYTNRNGKTESGELIHLIKYRLQNDPELAAKTAEPLLQDLKKFLIKTYPLRFRPFDCVIHPPSNTIRDFHLTQYLVNKLSSTSISDRSNEIVKIKPHSTVKAMSPKERHATLVNTMKIESNRSKNSPKGILIIDDVLDTGATAKELCRALEVAWPKVPRYYVALTYLMDRT